MSEEPADGFPFGTSDSAEERWCSCMNFFSAITTAMERAGRKVKSLQIFMTTPILQRPLRADSPSLDCPSLLQNLEELSINDGISEEFRYSSSREWDVDPWSMVLKNAENLRHLHIEGSSFARQVPSYDAGLSNFWSPGLVDIYFSDISVSDVTLGGIVEFHSKTLRSLYLLGIRLTSTSPVGNASLSWRNLLNRLRPQLHLIECAISQREDEMFEGQWDELDDIVDVWGDFDLGHVDIGSYLMREETFV